MNGTPYSICICICMGIRVLSFSISKPKDSIFSAVYLLFLVCFVVGSICCAHLVAWEVWVLD